MMSVFATDAVWDASSAGLGKEALEAVGPAG
jgi:hypothetical protein